MTLFDLPPLTPGYLDTNPQPQKSTDVRRTEQNRAALARGIHPATRVSLLDSEWGFSCRDCAHAEHVHRGNTRAWKCELHRLGMSHSAASDIRVSWPACALLTIRSETP